MQSFLEHLDQEQARCAGTTPSVMLANTFADDVYEWLFPVSGGSATGAATTRYKDLQMQLQALLLPLSAQMNLTVAQVSNQFFSAVPAVYEKLIQDAEAFYQYDPAATDITEVMAAYPGFKAITIYRLAHQLHLQKVPLLPRLLSEYAHSKTGIDIHPGATIGNSFFIDHGTGVVIGATTIIGNHVRIYQGVTLGALQVDKSLANTKRHPTIEDNCVIYANSTILGGKTTVGHDSVVGGNTWLTDSVPPYSIVVHQSKVKVRTRGLEEPIHFVI
jgi:serine O-acetyltransferase